MKQEHYTCCICKKEFYGYGNNPYPLRERGRCCDLCNMQVIKARMELICKKINEEQENGK